jgi:membrane carboxypeptidase/penicillin-binding protein
MPSVSHIIKMRSHRRSKTQNKVTLRSGWGCATLVSLSVVIIIIGLAFFSISLSQDLPSLENLPLLLEPPDGLLLQPTRFYDRSGEDIIYTLQNPAAPERRYIPIDKGRTAQSEEFLPPGLITATIAASDPTFWSNPGFSIQGIRQQKHTTIAQRLTADLLLWEEIPGIRLALRERLLAAQITHQFGREKIMEWYLNSTYYGNLAYGAEAAAQVYFGKPASDLNLAEAAVLAAVAEAPALNPLDAPATAIDRQQIVIDAMLGQGLITVEDAVSARDTKITFQKPVEPTSDIAPAYLDFVWDQLTTIIPGERLERGGFEIITTLDYDLQMQTACTVQTQLSSLGGGKLDVQTANGQSCEPALLLPTLTLDRNIALDHLGANVLVIDPSTGQILTMVGTNALGPAPAYQTSHPSGTLLTPFIYLTAFTRGFSPASLVWDIPIELSDNSPETLTPQGKFQGPVRLRLALANDYLTPALQITNQIGTENILQISHQLGLNSLNTTSLNSSEGGCPGCQLLDGGQITLMEAVQAFGVFPNQGVLVGQSFKKNSAAELPILQPVSILSIRDLNGETQISGLSAEYRPVINPQLAYLMVDTLSDEAARWPSLGHPNPLEIGRPAGAKMGQSSDRDNAWTVGFTPQLVVGVWMGNENLDSPSKGEVPPKVAAALWHAIIQYATEDFPASGWQMPPGISRMDVCDPSGMLPTNQCPTIVSEIFLSGQEPTQPDSLYQAYQINRETGRLATVFTPPELIEERTYLNIPPEAIFWAQSVGLEVPPETFDVITPVILTNTQITSPQMFAHLKGNITIRGSAMGDNFESYRLQIGQGINPSGWIVIQEDKTLSVENGVLGTWDTTGFEGLYALQLVILRSNQRVETATIQVTIDNSPPDIVAIYPKDGQNFSADTHNYITLSAQISDNLGINFVEFYINNQLIFFQTQTPFAIPWRTSPGAYTFRVKAVDLAGNLSEFEASFVVEP